MYSLSSVHITYWSHIKSYPGKLKWVPLLLHSPKFSRSKLLISNSQGSTNNWICKLLWEVLFVIGYFICIYNTLSPYCLLIFFTIKWNRKTCPHKHYSVMCCSLTFPSHFFTIFCCTLQNNFWPVAKWHAK